VLIIACSAGRHDHLVTTRRNGELLPAGEIVRRMVDVAQRTLRQSTVNIR